MKKTFKKILYLGILAIVLYAPKALAITCYTDETKDNLIMSTGEKDIIIDGTIPGITSTIITIIKIAVPIILVILGVIDLAKGILADKEDEMKKGQKLFVKRLIAGIIVFFVFTFVQMIIGYFGDDKDGQMMKCAKCFINGLDECDTVESDNSDAGDTPDSSGDDTPIQNIGLDEKSAAVYSYDANGKKATGIPESKTIHYNDEFVISPSVPKATGYTFVKWCTNKDGTGACYGVTPQNPAMIKPKETKPVDTTFYAIWEANTYTITFDFNYLEYNKILKELEYAKDTKNLSIKYDSSYNNLIRIQNSFSREGFVFDGWYTSRDGGVMVYDKNGKAVASSLIKLDYDIKKWNTDLKKSTVLWSSDYPSGVWKYPNDLTLYAHWSIQGIILDYNGGIGTTTTLYIPVNSKQHNDISDIFAERYNYTFDGWYTKPSGGEQIYDKNGKCVKSVYWTDNYPNCVWKNKGSVTLYAHWSRSKF